MFDVLLNQFWQLTISGIALGFIYVLISLGYTMVYGVLRMINFANSEIFMWGTFASVVVTERVFHFTATSKPATGGKLLLVLALCLVAAMLTSASVAMFVEFVAYRRLRGKGVNRLATLISAIGMSIALSEGMRILTNSRPVNVPRVLEKTVLFQVGSAVEIPAIAVVLRVAVPEQELLLIIELVGGQEVQGRVKLTRAALQRRTR